MFAYDFIRTEKLENESNGRFLGQDLFLAIDIFFLSSRNSSFEKVGSRKSGFRRNKENAKTIVHRTNQLCL